MLRAISRVTLVVPDYDEAIDHYTRTLGLQLLEDTPLPGGKRWVLVGPPGGGGGAALLLARAATDAQRHRVGDQTGGRVFLFLETDDFERDHARLRDRGIAFEETPRHEEYGRVVVFRDRYGNRWDLIEHRGSAPPPAHRETGTAADRGDAALRIRPATADDWPAIWPIFSAVVARGDTYLYDPDIAEADARRLWMNPSVETFVAERDGAIVGTYILKPNQPGLGDHVANAGYMVKPDTFGRGIGAAMCEHSLERARAAGFRAMQFNAVVASNERAVALWRRMGFAVIGTVPGAFRHRALGDVDLLIMHRRL